MEGLKKHQLLQEDLKKTSGSVRGHKQRAKYAIEMNRKLKSGIWNKDSNVSRICDIHAQLRHVRETAVISAQMKTQLPLLSTKYLSKLERKKELTMESWIFGYRCQVLAETNRWEHAGTA